MIPRASLSEVLADAEVFTDGDWVESKDQDASGDVRLTQLADIGDGAWLAKSARFMTSTKAKQLRCTYLKSGDVLIARMPDPVGRSCIFPGANMPCVTVVDVCVARPNPSRVNNRYLMHAINSPFGRRAILKHITGTTRQRISRKNLGQIEIPLPPLAEQKRIAGILDAADALRAKRRESIAQLDVLLQSTFLAMFGDPRKNERQWPTSTIGSVVTDMRGGAALRPEDFVQSGFPILHKGAIKAFGEVSIDVRKKTFSTNAYARSHRNNVVDRSYLAVTLRDLVPSGPTIGYTTDLQFGPFDEYLLAQGSYGFRADENKVSRAYLVYLSNNRSFRYVLLQNAVGSTQIHIRTPIYLNIRIPLPPIDLQRRFASVVESVNHQKSHLHSYTDELNTLFSSLQHRAFNGEL